MRTIALVNQKGGCGKTTTAINLAAVCARRGLRTLVVDMDPQSHCAAGLGVPDSALDRSIAQGLLADLSRGFLRESLVWEVSRNLDLAPSSMSLAGLEAPGGGLHGLEDRDRRLLQLLRHLAPHYDRCFIDCPPNIGLLTYNALRAAGEAIIPVQTEYFALRGAAKQWDTIKHLAESVNHPIACYVLPTLFDENEPIAADILGKIRSQFKGRVIPITVHDRPEIREAAAFGQPVAEFAAESDAVKDFERLADWLDDHPADPPELQVEVKRAITVPFLREGESGLRGDRDESADPVAATPANSRAAEMARRVRTLTMQRAPERDHPVEPAIAEPGKLHPSVLRDTSRVTTRGAVERGPSAGAVVRTVEEAVRLASLRRNVLIEQKDVPPPLHAVRSSIIRLFGVRQTGQGVLFVQPGAPSMRVTVAGTFNNWSATATPLRFNPETGVFELLLPLERGEHQYRLVVDGRWQTDPYNNNRRLNEFGEENNLLFVK